MKKKLRIIRSISGVITNSSTEIFTISGPDSLKAMIGSGLYRKYKKNFIHLATEEDVEKFLISGGFDHHYKSYMAFSELNSLCAWRATEEFIKYFPTKIDNIWNVIKDQVCKELIGTIIYYDYRRNSKIIETLRIKFPEIDEEKESKGSLNYKYYWNLD